MTFHSFKYRLPFVTPLHTSKADFHFREGIILELQDEGNNFYGEVAPLPGFSTETLEQLEGQIIKEQDHLNEMLRSSSPTDVLQDWYCSQNIASSLQFGLDSLAYQLEASNNKQQLQQYLFDNASTQIPVNTVVSLPDEDIDQRIEREIAAGFSTIKFKIGINFEREYSRLQKIRSSYPKISIRVDANQAWSLDDAINHCKKLSALDIEYCEEPLREATAKNFETLHSASDLPLALDESVTKSLFGSDILRFVSYVIIKPMFMGSFTTIFETKYLADTHDCKAVFTTSLESGLGRSMTALLASGLGSKNSAHGLATGNMLARDVHSDLAYIKRGSYHLDQHFLTIDSLKIREVCTKIF